MQAAVVSSAAIRVDSRGSSWPTNHASSLGRAMILAVFFQQRVALLRSFFGWGRGERIVLPGSSEPMEI